MRLAPKSASGGLPGDLEPSSESTSAVLRDGVSRLSAVVAGVRRGLAGRLSATSGHLAGPGGVVTQLDGADRWSTAAVRGAVTVQSRGDAVTEATNPKTGLGIAASFFIVGAVASQSGGDPTTEYTIRQLLDNGWRIRFTDPGTIEGDTDMHFDRVDEKGLHTMWLSTELMNLPPKKLMAAIAEGHSVTNFRRSLSFCA